MGFVMNLLPIIAMFGIMYFLLIVPEKKRTKKYNEMIGQLEINDEIISRGGIMGKIIVLEDEYVIISTGKNNTQIKMSKNGIAAKVNEEFTK